MLENTICFVLVKNKRICGWRPKIQPPCPALSTNEYVKCTPSLSLLYAFPERRGFGFCRFWYFRCCDRRQDQRDAIRREFERNAWWNFQKFQNRTVNDQGVTVAVANQLLLHGSSVNTVCWSNCFIVSPKKQLSSDEKRPRVSAKWFYSIKNFLNSVSSSS